MRKRYFMSKDRELIVSCREDEINLYRRWSESKYFRMKLDRLDDCTREYCGIRICVTNGHIQVFNREATGNYKSIEMKNIPATALHEQEKYINIKTRYYVSDPDARLFVSYTRGIPKAFLKNADTGEYEPQILTFSSYNNQKRYEIGEYIIITNDDRYVSVIVKNVHIHMHEIPLTAVNGYVV